MGDILERNVMFRLSLLNNVFILLVINKGLLEKKKEILVFPTGVEPMNIII